MCRAGSQSQASERVLSAQEPTPEPSRNGAATLNAHDPGSDSEDDLLVVKRRDALDVGASLAAEAAPAELGTLGQGLPSLLAALQCMWLLVTSADC